MNNKQVVINRLFQKKKTNRRWGGHGTFRGIEEIVCGNPRGQLKKKCTFQRCLRKNQG